MKLMIDIPDSFYSDLKENRIDLGAIGCQLLLDKVKNGTPLEECEDAIKYFNIINELSETLGVSYNFVDEKIKEIIPSLKKPSISEDGTLTVNVEDGNKVSRVLVCGDNHFGGLYYPEQEPCTDAISRQAVLMELDKYLCGVPFDEKGIDTVIKELPLVTPQYTDAEIQKMQDLESVEIQKAYEIGKEEGNSENLNRWIPVSERLPELNRPLLVTAYHRVYYGHLISESGNYGYPVFRIHGLGDKNRDWVQETMSHEPYSLGRIDAWMYFDIPEPYKASPTGAEKEV